MKRNLENGLKKSQFKSEIYEYERWGDLVFSDDVDEVIEENKEIKELNKISYNEFKYTDTKHRFDLTNIEYDKINELVREVNKIKKQLEEQETEDIDTVERELNKMF